MGRQGIIKRRENSFMDDTQIIALYFARDEAAITQTASKYGTGLKRMAQNLLYNTEDAEECVNDTYHAAWNQIPPTYPQCLFAFLGRIVRNISISRIRMQKAKKRDTGLEVLLSELEDCIPSGNTVEQVIEGQELTGYISDWLKTLTKEERICFVRRYWHGEEVKELAVKCHVTAAQMAQRMLRLRKSLKKYLEGKGVAV